MTFEDDKYIILNVGGGHNGASPDDKTADLCPTCHIEVQHFITEGPTVKQQISFSDERVAMRYLIGKGYVVYKKPKYDKRGFKAKV